MKLSWRIYHFKARKLLAIRALAIRIKKLLSNNAKWLYGQATA
jgi:hypothetical protein